MNRVLAAVVLAITLAASVEQGWVPLFNGKDLTGWKNYGEEKRLVENGEILGQAVTKEYGYLGTGKTYKNFEMREKFKAEGTGNSGIFYHAAITGTTINGVQVEVDPRPNMHTGGLGQRRAGARLPRPIAEVPGWHHRAAAARRR